jgi:hypothetical protein
MLAELLREEIILPSEIAGRAFLISFARAARALAGLRFLATAIFHSGEIQ